MIEHDNNDVITVMITRQGIAVDIDETLSWTIRYWVENMQKHFGNPEGLSVEEMIKKYRYTQNVPYWQSKEALEWIEKKIHDDALQEELPLVPKAKDTLIEIDKIIPVAAYLTIRPELIRTGTENWIRKHGFPQAPVICKPTDMPRKDAIIWKAKILEESYPGIVGIIDDNPEITTRLSKDYKGYVFMFNNTTGDPSRNFIACEDWDAVLEEIKRVFSKNIVNNA